MSARRFGPRDVAWALPMLALALPSLAWSQVAPVAQAARAAPASLALPSLPVEAERALVWVAVGALVPLLAIAATAFAKASVLLGILRAGLGTEGGLPAVLVPALATILTLVVMAPVGARALDAARPWPASDAGAAAWAGAAARAWPVLDGFLQAHTRPQDRATLAALSAPRPPEPAESPPPPDAGIAPDAGPGPDAGPDAGLASDAGPAPDAGPGPDAGPAPDAGPGAKPESAPQAAATMGPPTAPLSPVAAIAAFLISELTAAFSLGVLLLLPFVLIDLLVANTLATVGFTTLPAGLLALPFKLLLFVAVDGWALFVRGFVAAYTT